MKKKILILIVSFLLIIGLVFIFFKLNDKSLISKQKTVNNIIFKDAKIKKIENTYNFTVVVKCKGDEANIESFDASIKNKKGKEIDILSGYVGGIKKGETKIITIRSEKDLSDAYDINYTVYNE